jgi:hypothetical protein
MHIDITIPFWGMIGIIIAVGLIVCWIISYYGAQEGGYLGGLFHALLILVIGFIMIAICIGMIVGKYVF